MSNEKNKWTGALPVGTRVGIHPALDDWMRGDRYGEIVGYSYFIWKKERTPNYKVKLDKSGTIKKIAPNLIEA